MKDNIKKTANLQGRRSTWRRLVRVVEADVAGGGVRWRLAAPGGPR